MPSDAFSEITDPAALGAILNPGRDHNNPPSLVELLEEETLDLRTRRDELLGSVSRVPASIEDEDTNKRAADLVRMVTACRKKAETNRVDRKEPFLAAERSVDAAYKKITDPLDLAKKQVEQRMTAFQRAKADAERRAREAEARRQWEEAERQRQEAAAAAAAMRTEEDLEAAAAAEDRAKQQAADAERARREAAAKPAELSRSRGDFGAVASLHTFWNFADLDRDTVDLEALRQHLPIDAIEKAVRSFIKAGERKLRGCTIFEDHQTRVR